MNANPFLTLEPWLPQILEEIKRDIKSDHLAQDPAFARAHFGNRPIQRLTNEELFAPYIRELLAGNEPLVEWAVNRWVFRHTDLYQHFADRLSAIRADFSNLTSLTPAEEEQVLAGAPDRFGHQDTFLFARLNQVVISPTRMEALRVAALAEQKAKMAQKAEAEVTRSREELELRHKTELARLIDKYEGRLSGMQKKYLTDTEALKKQIRALQKR